jgi:hypothetical protein
VSGDPIDTQQLHEIALATARMEGKLDGALSQGADHENRIRSLEKLDGALAQGADHEARIRSLEMAMWKAAGAGSAAGAAAGGMVAAIVAQFVGG